MPRGKRATKATQTAESYKHPESESPMRPEVGTQAQFKKKKAPVTYRAPPQRKRRARLVPRHRL